VEVVERKSLIAFSFRATVLFVLLVLPIPWLADGYVAAVGRLTNAVLSVVDAGAGVGARFDLPARIRKEGSWKASLRVENRRSGATAWGRLHMRSLSYRPVATFVALAGASRMKGVRPRLALWAGGLFSMFWMTTGFCALPILSQFATAGAFGKVPGLVVRTVYQAIATPCHGGRDARARMVAARWRSSRDGPDHSAQTAVQPLDLAQAKIWLAFPEGRVIPV
jgi:hypothetical protein